MKKIAIVTSTRAEFGLLTPVIRELRLYEKDSFRVDLIVTGTHLIEKFGYTVNEIKKLDIRIDHYIEIKMNSETEQDIANTQSEALIKFSKLFNVEKYDGVLLLGDRYELLAIAIAAGNCHIPIFHMCGGDTTEGAIDEWVRHSITKMSYLHFVTNVDSYKRVIQLGENPTRVFNYGSTSVDNIIELADMNKGDVITELGLACQKYAVGTYHPVTIDNVDVEKMICEFITAMENFPDIHFIITKSNADCGGGRINKMLDDANERCSNISVYSSLGARRYLSLVKHALFVIGNSSSGIIEAPILKVPTVNIGDRQKGRLQADSIVNCKEDADSIVNAINVVTSEKFRQRCTNQKSLYGDGKSAKKISRKIFEVVNEDRIDLKKKFYDMEMNI